MLFGILMILCGIFIISGTIIVCTVIDKDWKMTIGFLLIEVIIGYFIVICYFALKTPQLTLTL
jgi:uncharacterized membrane protein YczE